MQAALRAVAAFAQHDPAPVGQARHRFHPAVARPLAQFGHAEETRLAQTGIRARYVPFVFQADPQRAIDVFHHRFDVEADMAPVRSDKCQHSRNRGQTRPCLQWQVDQQAPVTVAHRPQAARSRHQRRIAAKAPVGPCQPPHARQLQGAKRLAFGSAYLRADVFHLHSRVDRDRIDALRRPGQPEQRQDQQGKGKPSAHRPPLADSLSRSTANAALQQQGKVGKRRIRQGGT